MSRFKRLVVEIRHRSLWQVLLIYVGGAWVCYEIIDTITDRLALPEWLPVLAIILFLIGLPVVLATAFVHEVSPPTVAPAEPTPLTEAEAARVEVETVAARLEARRRHRFLTRRNAVASFVVALAAWGVVTTAWLLLGDRGPASKVERKSIAVLPFENLSPDPDDAYFADGIHDEIISQLGKIASLKVISRTSVMEYRGQRGNLREIADELGVTNVLEGTVRRAGDRVRITTQLIDADSDVHLWAENYEEELSDIFAVQADIAERIAIALEAELSSEEETSIAGQPTDNLEAYDYYLRGIEYLGRPGVRQENYRNAQRMLEQAAEFDPRFALAYARLSILHTNAYEYALDRSEERLRQAREAADRALQIDPDPAMGHVALGYYYHSVRDYDRALQELAIAERGLPGSTRVLWVRGLILKRQGKWDEALASQERALALSPREPNLLFMLGVTHNSLRRYEEAETYFDRALALQPDFVEVALVKALVPLWGRGDTGPLRTLVDGIPPGFDPWGLVTALRMYVEYFDRDYAAALEVLSHSELEYFEWPGPGGSGSGGTAPRTLYTGLCHAAMGETARAQAAADSARRDLEARLRERPDDPRLHMALSLTHAVLGNRDEAVRDAQEAVELMPISEDAMAGPDYVRNLATIYAWFGEVDAAVEQFEQYLSVPAPQSIKFILLDPVIDPVRDHPRFQTLLEKYE